MQIGIQAAQLGRLANGAAVRSAARAAEQLGYASIWVIDRVPTCTAGGQDALDPFVVLAASASATSRIGVGAGILVAPWYRPVLLARALTSIDVVSDGRLTVGLGLGWSTDMYDTVAVPPTGLGPRLDETLDVLDRDWGGPVCGADDGPSRHEPGSGSGSSFPDNTITPVRRPRPPVLLAASSEQGLERVARRADGWITSATDAAVLAERWATIGRAAEIHRRDPGALRFVARADVQLHDRAIAGPRRLYEGSVEQVAEDLAVVRDLGVDELVLGLLGDPGLDEALDAFARLAEANEKTGSGLVR